MAVASQLLDEACSPWTAEAHRKLRNAGHSSKVRNANSLSSARRHTNAACLATAHCVGGSQAERAWGRAQPEDALWQAAEAGDLAKCTRLLGAGTHPVGYMVSEPVAAVCCNRPASRFGRCSSRTAESVVEHTDRVGPGLQVGNGWTALHYAAENGRLEVARLLLDSGADRAHRPGLGTRDYPYGKTARDLAVEQNHPAVAVLLE